MPLPDIKSYVDLTLTDKDPQQLYEEAEVDLQSKLADWVPREGNIEVLLMESLALQVGEAIFAINRLPAAIMLVLGEFYGVFRDEGTRPTVLLQFTVADLEGHTIPASTAVQLLFDNGFDPIVFTLDTSLVIPAGSQVGTVTATASSYTQDANGTLAGTVLPTLEVLYFVTNVITLTDIRDGRDPEEDADWINRISYRLSRQTQALVVPSQFLAYVLEVPWVNRGKVIDNYDPAVGPPGSNPGHVTVAVYGETSVLTTTQKDSIAAGIDQLVQSNLTVHIIDPTITPVDVAATVKTAPGFSGDAVIANVQAALFAFLSPSTWDFSTLVRLNLLISVINNAEGVAYVTTLDTPAFDYTLPGAAPLVAPGTFTISAT